MALGYKLFQAMPKDGSLISLPCITRGSGCSPPQVASVPLGAVQVSLGLSPTLGTTAKPGQHLRGGKAALPNPGRALVVFCK